MAEYDRGLDLGDMIIVNATLYNDTEEDIPCTFKIQRQELLLNEDRQYSIGINRFKIPTSGVPWLLPHPESLAHQSQQHSNNKGIFLGPSAYKLGLGLEGSQIIEPLPGGTTVASVGSIIDALNRTMSSIYAKLVKLDHYATEKKIKSVGVLSTTDPHTNIYFEEGQPTIVYPVEYSMSFHTGRYLYNNVDPNTYNGPRRLNKCVRISATDFNQTEDVSFINLRPQYIRFGNLQINTQIPVSLQGCLVSVYISIYDGKSGVVAANNDEAPLTFRPPDSNLLAVYPVFLNVSIAWFLTQYTGDSLVEFSDQFTRKMPKFFPPEDKNKPFQFRPEVPFSTYGQHYIRSQFGEDGFYPAFYIDIVPSNSLSLSGYEYAHFPLQSVELVMNPCVPSPFTFDMYPQFPPIPPIFEYDPNDHGIRVKYSLQMMHMGLDIKFNTALMNLLKLHKKVDPSVDDDEMHTLKYPGAVGLPPWDIQPTLAFDKISAPPDPGPSPCPPTPTPTPVPPITDWEKLVFRTSLPVRQEIVGDSTNRTSNILTDFQIDAYPDDAQFSFASSNAIPPRLYSLTQKSSTLNSFDIELFMERFGGFQSRIYIQPHHSANVILVFIPQTR